jgi:very-short-patch-repair endonuclease
MRKDTKESFIEKAYKVHGDKYDYSLVKYTSSKVKVKIVCTEHGEFLQSPNMHLLGSGCSICNSKKPKGFNKTPKNTFILKANLKHKNKYDYTLARFNSLNDKIKIICPEHGVFLQEANSHLKGAGCSWCSGNKKRTKKSFILKANKVHNNKYNYCLTNYINNQSKVEIICATHGSFMQTPASHLSGTGCPSCSESKAEKKISNILLENNIKYIPQYKFKDCRNVLPLPFDFYIPEKNLCIEYDGEHHFNSRWVGKDELKKIQLRDEIKTNYCKKNNINLIRIKYDQNIESALEVLL